MSLTLASALLLGQLFIGTAFAINSSPTIGSVEDDFVAYLDENHPDLMFGTSEFVDYLVNILMCDSDSRLASLPNYDDIRFYAGEYLYQMDLWQAVKSEDDDSLFTLSESYKEKTLDEIKVEASEQQVADEQLYT